MVPIYICEDRVEMLALIKKQINHFCMIEDFDFQLTLATQNPEILLEQLQQSAPQGIYFIDVDLSHETIDGFELGKQIRRLDPRGFLIYVTTHDELLPEVFKHRVEALDYILKDDPKKMRQRIHQALLSVQQLLQAEQIDPTAYFTVETASRILHLPLSEIHYFETTHKKHVVAVITSEDYIEFYGNLNQLEKQFQTDFFRTHQSYLVNKHQIKSIDKKQRLVILKDGTTCLIARTKLKKLAF